MATTRTIREGTRARQHSTEDLFCRQPDRARESARPQASGQRTSARKRRARFSVRQIRRCSSESSRPSAESAVTASFRSRQIRTPQGRWPATLPRPQSSSGRSSLRLPIPRIPRRRRARRPRGATTRSFSAAKAFEESGSAFRARSIMRRPHRPGANVDAGDFLQSRRK